MQASTKRVVCIGGGHVNCQLLKILRTSLPEGCKLTMVSEYPKSYYSGMLPGAVAGLYKPEELQIPLAPLSIFCGANFIQQKVTKIDATKSLLHLQDGSNLEYDILGINIGSRTLGTFSVKGVAEHALTTRPIDELLPKIIAAEKGLLDRKQIPKVVVVGGGAAGTELAFGFKNRWSKLFGQEIHVTQLVAGPAPIRHAAPALHSLISMKQKQQNIEVICGVNVAEVTAEGVRATDGRFFEGNTTIWATGPEPQGLTMECQGLDISKGYFRVNDYMQSTSASNVFAGGDCVTLSTYEEEKPVFPGKAGVYAVRAGPVIAHNISAMARGDDIEKFQKYIPQRQFLSLLMTGDGQALGTKFGVAFKGLWVWRMKDWIDVGFMKLFQPQYLFHDYENLGTAKPDYENKELFESAEAFNKKKQDAVAKVATMTPEEGVACLHTDEKEEDFMEPLMVVDRMAKDDAFREAVAKHF